MIPFQTSNKQMQGTQLQNHNLETQKSKNTNNVLN